APGDGRDASPFATLAQAASASTAGETIFVLFGDGGTAGLDAGITLQAGQSLIGQGVSAPVVVALNGAPLVLLAAGSSPLLTRATSGTTVQLATNNTVRGLYVTSSDGTGIAGTGFSTLQASDLSVAAQGGPALNLQNGTVAANLRTVSSSGSATAGLALASVSGAFTVWGDGTTAASGGTIQGTGGDAVSLSGPASVTLRLMRILPLHSGIVASSASGPLTVERSTIDYQGSAPAGIAYGVRFASAGGSAALVLDGTTVSNKLDASPAVSVSATGNATLSFTMRDGNTGDGFASRLTNLFGSGVAVSSGDSPGSAAHVTARVSGTSFDNAAPNGTNNLELGVAQLAVLDYVVSGNTFDAVAKASAVAGVINLSAFDSGRFGSTTAADSIVGNTVQNVGTGAAATQLGYVGIRVALDNAVPGINQRVVIEGNDIHNLWRQGVLISGRGNANDINVRLAGNTIGTVGAPVARSNRRAVEVEAQNNSTVKIEVLNNPSIENTSTSGANSALAIRSTATTSTVAATVVGNVIGNTNGAITAGRFRAETLAGTTAGMCLDLRSNTLDASASLFELIAASAGAFKVRGPGAAVVTGPDVTAANTVGTGSVSGAPTFNGNVACAAPTL
ncbi:MAG TPA: hypothetical protein VFH27_10715, partial [Longimicrobiaceae bacterium]|nr:hypothetical protein [Longimicrobiaceae bacterium]